MHISEIDHKHIGSPNEVLEPGQQVNEILGIDEDNESIINQSNITKRECH